MTAAALNEISSWNLKNQKKKFREPAGTEKKVPEGETKKAALIKIKIQ